MSLYWLGPESVYAEHEHRTRRLSEAARPLRWTRWTGALHAAQALVARGESSRRAA